MSNIPFDKIIDKVFDSFKKITPALVAVAIIAGLILFLPEPILSKLGLNELPSLVVSVIGTVFLFSCALIITIIGSVCWGALGKSIKQKQTYANLKKRYLGLSDDQKKIIIGMMLSDSKSAHLDATSGNTIYLVENGFIYRPHQILDAFDLQENSYTYVPQPWLFEIFQQNPELFQLKR